MKFRPTKPGLTKLLGGMFFYIIRHQIVGTYTIESDTMREHDFEDWKRQITEKLNSTGVDYSVTGWQMKVNWGNNLTDTKFWTGFLTIDFHL